MSASKFLVPGSSISVPFGSILSMDMSLITVKEAVSISGFIPQNLQVRVHSLETKKMLSAKGILLENLGDVPLTWFVVERPSKPTRIDRFELVPGGLISVEDVSFSSGRDAYLSFLAYPSSQNNQSGHYMPVSVRITIGLGCDHISLKMSC